MLAYMAKGQVMYMNDGLEESLGTIPDPERFVDETKVCRY